MYNKGDSIIVSTCLAFNCAKGTADILPITSAQVEKIKTLEPTNVDAVQNSGYDLVLYTCTYGGATRVTVFCNRVLEKAE